MAKLKLGLDAGHGSTDPGARDNYGNYEREQMIKLVDEIERQAISRGIDVAKYPNDQNSYANGNLAQWAKNNQINEMVEFHFDTGNAGSILIMPSADQVDKNLNAVINSYFGSKGIIARPELYNINTLAAVGIPNRLVEVYGGWDNADIDKFSNELVNLADDILDAIIAGFDGGENYPSQEIVPPPIHPSGDNWDIVPNVKEWNYPLSNGKLETGYCFQGRDTRSKKYVWSGQKKYSPGMSTFVAVETTNWTPGGNNGMGNGSEIGYVKYKLVDRFLGEDGNWYDVQGQDIWIVSHVDNIDQFRIEKK